MFIHPSFSQTSRIVFLFLVGIGTILAFQRRVKHPFIPHKTTSFVLKREVTIMESMTALTDLNEAQFAAVTANLAHIRVQAGPGSGKTRVLVNRVAYMIREQHVLPRDILAVTFTNKAANEMKNRLGKLLSDKSTPQQDKNYELVHCTTLHSFCASVLRKYGPKSERSFTIYDDTDTKKLVRNILTEMNEDLENSSPVRVREAISMLKRECLLDRSSSFDNNDNNGLESKTGVGSQQLLFKDPFYKIVQKVYQQYREALRMNNAKDFDDLVGDTLSLLRASDRAKMTANEAVNNYSKIKGGKSYLVNPLPSITPDEADAIQGTGHYTLYPFYNVYPLTPIFSSLLTQDIKCLHH